LETKDNRLNIDFDKLEDVIKGSNIKLLVFMNPWNPCGRIWSKE
jgi:bifunctional pyridoxal-dependent enzyme with beta-cystathionase and maltose regulon repressor activities